MNLLIENALYGEDKESTYPDNVGSKIRSKGMGRGLGTGKGKGPIFRGRRISGLRDYDGDGVMNAFDCEPRNPRKQGPQHAKSDYYEPEDDDEEWYVDYPARKGRVKRVHFKKWTSSGGRIPTGSEYLDED